MGRVDEERGGGEALLKDDNVDLEISRDSSSATPCM